jgi:hypothetical protein
MKKAPIKFLLFALTLVVGFLVVQSNVHASCQENPGECKTGCSGGDWLNSGDCMYVSTCNVFDCDLAGGDLFGTSSCYMIDHPVSSSPCSSNLTVMCSCGTTGCPPDTIPSPLDPNCEGNNGDLGYLLSKILPFIPIVVGLILLAMIVMGGIKIATSGENEEQKKKGIQTITNALIGAAVVVLAVVIIGIFEAIFKVKILYGIGA